MQHVMSLGVGPWYPHLGVATDISTVALQGVEIVEEVDPVVSGCIADGPEFGCASGALSGFRISPTAPT